MCKKLLLVVIMLMAACKSENENVNINDAGSTEVVYGVSGKALTGNNFKIPVPQGYNWEITQSWADHCQKCNANGYDKIADGYFGDFCHLNHSSSDPKEHGCLEYCKYAWDFSLSGDNDLGKSVLASGDGVVQVAKVGKNQYGGYIGGGWGNTVVINHGNNVCSRYAHLKDDSVTVTKDQQVCQGLKIGEVGGTPSYSPHLHFQFEDCETHLPLKMGFTDGNGIPKCVMGDDIYTNGVYTALKLTNVEKKYCTEDDLDPYKESAKPILACGMQCPLKGNCMQEGEVPFSDIAGKDSSMGLATSYLWHECAIVGTSDGKFHPYFMITRAEALKIAMVLFGLDKGCEGTTEPFGDVNLWDWFYPYVVCGVKHGIISTASSSFNPDDKVSFGEAAKIAVEAAVKAGKRVMKSGKYADFPKLKSTDWSYKYLQTLAFYNGIEPDLSMKDPDDYVKRGEYARMVASLSPCYCYKNKCENNCGCGDAFICQDAQVSAEKKAEKGKYAGVGTSENDATSFSASSEGKDAGAPVKDVSVPEIESCKPYCYQKNCGSDLCGGSCGTCPSDMFCSTSEGKCQYICKMPSCEEIGCECGKCPLSTPGCDGSSKICGECPSGKICNNGKCEKKACIPVCNNKKCGDDGCGGSCGTCPEDAFCGLMNTCIFACKMPTCKEIGCECGFCTVKTAYCEGLKLLCDTCAPGEVCTNNTCFADPCYNCKGQCVNGKCVIPPVPGPCDPAKGYDIYFNTDPGKSGKWETFTSPNKKYYSSTFLLSASLHYECSELPAMLMLSGFTGNGVVWLKDDTLPNFMFWPDYKGSIISSSPSKGISLVGKFMSFSMNSNMLIRIPYN